VICGTCGTENEVGRKFCKECANRLAAVCPSCAAANAPDAKFCGECATPLRSAGSASQATAAPPAPASAPPTAAAVPVAERRVVSILFADLVGFTALSEGRDAEETRELLSRYFDLAREVIGRYGGTVEKFIGDAVMAVWGAPVAREDDAERAVRAALELVDAIRSLGPGVRARAGVLTGEAAVTLGATNQGMVAGDIVNTASRLQGAAQPGGVLVGEATMRAASKSIVFEPVGTQELKGKSSPVPAWLAKRVVAEVGGRNRSEALEAPFVGRDEELRLLKDLFHATGRDRRVRLVSVIGPAGIGKSRLSWEFGKYVDGLVEDTYWHAGRSPAYGEGITFWALGEMVRGRCGLLEGEDEATTRVKVGATVAAWVTDPEEQAWIERALLALLGVESDIGSDQLFAAWRTFFERIAQRGPVALVFEDLHFADSGLLDFIDHLLEWSKGLPIYIVTLARPELLERRSDWGAGKRNFTSLTLDPLDEASMRILLAGLVPGLPEAAVRAIIARADGVPLYAVETVRMLVAQGQLTEHDGIYVPTGDLTQLAVPETLTALIAARLDGLDPADRSLVHDAAVVGQSFTLAGLSAVSGQDPATLEPRLRSLVRRELLTREADPRSPERGQYAFVQALIREVAYNTLARNDRKVRHLAAARFFEGLGTEELAGALAGHYLAAHANAPDGPESAALAAQARIALRAAADRASALGAHEQAVDFLEQALTVTSDPDEIGEVLERAGEAASSAGRHDRARGLLQRALDQRRAGSDRTAIARATTALARALNATYQTEASLPLLEAAVAESADLAAEPDVVALRGELARAYYMSGDNRRAAEVADAVLEVAEHANLVSIVAYTLVTRGSALGNLGRVHEALGVIDAGQKLAEAHGLSASVLRALINRSNYELDLRQSLEMARAAIALARRLGQRRMATIAFGNSVESAMRTGQWEWVSAEAEGMVGDELDPIDRAQLVGSVLQLRAFRGNDASPLLKEHEQLLANQAGYQAAVALADSRGVIALAAGDPGHAFSEFMFQAQADALNAPYALPLAGRAALWCRDVEGARQALQLLDAGGFHRPHLEASRVTIGAGIAVLEGRPGDALGLYREALRAWRSLGLVWDEALCAIDMAMLIGPSEPDVEAAAGSARETLRRLGAQPFLARLEGAMAAAPARPATPAPPAAERQPR